MGLVLHGHPELVHPLPGAEYAGDDPDGFLPRDELVRHFERWAESFDAPVKCGIDARAVRPVRDGFVVDTNDGRYHARNVVVATSTYQNVRIPAVSAKLPHRLLQLTSHDYKNPDMVPPGAVLVVGSGQTGAQIAEELNDAAGGCTSASGARAGSPDATVDGTPSSGSGTWDTWTVPRPCSTAPPTGSAATPRNRQERRVHP